MKRFHWNKIVLLLPLLTLVACSDEKSAPAPKAAASAPAAAAAAPTTATDDEQTSATPPSVVDLATIKWETNNDDPPIGDPKALKGGTLRVTLPDYPQTFRLVGPNSNDMFANYNRLTHTDMTLVARHPTTDHYIPLLATHWAVMPDHRTVVYKLDPDVRWSDGREVTADDYVWGYEFLLNPLIKEPYYASILPEYIESVQKLDKYVLKIVGRKPSWRPLEDFTIIPYPKHAIQLDEQWVDRDNYKPMVVTGPYTVTDWKTNESVTLSHVPNWWGTNKRYFQGLYNPDKIVIKTIADSDQGLDYLQKGELDYYEVSRARMWSEQMNFPALKNNWISAVRVFVEAPEGMSGIGINLNSQSAALRDKNFRKALQHLFNFDELNKQLMYNAYYRKVSAFHGTEYANKDLKGYEFSPPKAKEYLAKAGYTKRGADGILVNDQGKRASFELVMGGPGLEKHLTVIQNVFRAAGVEMTIKKMEGGAAFNKMREKATDAFLVSMTGGFYPDPYEYYATAFKDKEQTNNFWNYGTPETDKLIRTYMFNMDKQKRLDAIAELDRRIQDEAFYIPFWSAPYIRYAAWDYVRFPEFYYPKRANHITDAMVLWIDPQRQADLKDAMAANRPLPGPGAAIDVDPYGVKKRVTGE